MLELGQLIPAIGAGLGVTLLMTVSAFVFGTIIAIPISVLRSSSIAPARFLGAAYIEIFRGIPTLVWLMIIYYGITPILRLDPLPAAIVGLSLIAGAYLGENLRAGIENVAPGQREAGKSLGLTDRNLFVRIIAPQAVNLAAPPSASYLIGLLKESAIASVIGVTDIIFMANLEVTRGVPALIAFVLAGVLYLILSVPLSILSRSVDSAVRKRVSSV